MTNTEKMQAIALVEDMVKNGYHLMQYKDAEALIDYYDCPRFNLAYWQKAHDQFLARKKA